MTVNQSKHRRGYVSWGRNKGTNKTVPIQTFSLGRQSLWRPRVIRSEVDAGQSEEPCDYTVKSDAATAVRRDSHLAENIDIPFNSRTGGIDAFGADTLLELVRVVDTLAPSAELAWTSDTYRD